MSDDKTEKDAAFDGLVAASGVSISDEERARLRGAFDTLEALATRVRDPLRDWRSKPMPSFAATPRPRNENDRDPTDR